MARRSNNPRKSVPKKNARATAGHKKNRASKSKQVAKDFSFTPRTELGRDLWAIRQRIVASGVELLDWDGVHRELMSRRGGVDAEDE
jgi:hypothetical protein